jgi:uncharacterized membrane protein YfcA
VQNLIVLTVVGFVAQLVDGALGMAYGATSATLVLAAGYAIGAFIGAVILSSISADIAKPWMAGILLALGVYVLLRFTIGGAPRTRGRSYVRGRYLAPLGFGAGLIDATGGGGWGPVSTPTLLATGKIEPRKVVGSVDTSEFLVALAASIGFIVGLGSQGIKPAIVLPLIAGGVLAAPLAAWLVQLMTARLLGAAVGGLILLTNARTMADAFEAGGDVRNPIYLAIVLVWVAAVALVVYQHRRDGLPLTNTRPRRKPGAEPATEPAS